MILNSVSQHNCFITQGNYMGYMFRLLIGHLQAYFVSWVTRSYAHTGIPLCLHPWKYIKINSSHRCDVQILFTSVGQIKLDHLWSNFMYNNNNNYYYYYYYLLQLSYHPVAVVILHVYKTWNWLLINLSLEGYMRSM